MVADVRMVQPGPDDPTAWGGNNQSGPIDLATARNGHSGPHGRLDFESETFVVQTVALRGREGGGAAELGGEQANALRSSQGGGDKPYVLAFDTTQISSDKNYSSPKDGDPCHPLAALAHPPAVCITGDITHTLKADGFDGSEDGTGRGHDRLTTARAVRRLLPSECEILQGFSGDHTRWVAGGQVQKDGPRYKQIGNSMPVPMIRWLGGRVDRALRDA